MKTLFTIACLLLIFNANAQPFNLEWQKFPGGSAAEFNDYMGNTIVVTNDGGYVFTSMTYSNDGDVSGNHGGIDMWVVRLDAAGNTQWQKCLGGSGNDYGKNIIMTTDEGILVGGATTSNDGNISGNHGGALDIFLIKLDGEGNVEWEKTLGSSKTEDCFSFIQDDDLNYIVAGFTDGNDGDVSGNHGQYDTWVVKLNPTGDILWQKCYGGSRDDAYNHTTTIMQSAEGGYMLSTVSCSVDGQVTGLHPVPWKWVVDAWLVKLDLDGNIEWENCYGGAAFDAFENIMQTSAGDYILAGFIAPQSDKEASLTYGGFDWWICKINQSGDIIWSRHYGGAGWEAVHSEIFELENGDLIAASGTRSNDFDCTGGTIGADNPTDLWILKLDSEGNILGSQFFNETGYQNLSAAIMNADGSMVISAMSDSANFTGYGFDLDNTNHAQIWIMKLLPNPFDTLAITTVSLSQNIFCQSDIETELTVSFTTRGTFESDNVFTAQLSDAFGNFSSPTAIGSVNTNSSESITCALPPGLPLGNYYAVRVISSDPPYTGISTGKYFSIQCQPPNPIYSSAITGTSATLRWNFCSEKYQLQYHKISGNKWTTINTRNDSIVISALQPTTTYEWKVRAKCSENPVTWSDWSAVKTFTTAAERNLFNVAAESALEVYPNPFSQSTLITFQLQSDENVSLKIFDVEGRLIRTLVDESLSAGIHELTWNTCNENDNAVNAGIYFLKMETQGETKTILLSTVK